MDLKRESAVEIRFRKLKPGPGLAADIVTADQRRRLQASMLELVDGHGAANTSVRSLTRCAGVSTSTFYKHFRDRDDCLAATYEAVTAEVIGNASAARLSESDRRASLRAVVATIMESFASNPQVARLMLVDIYSARIEDRRISSSVESLEKLLVEVLLAAPRDTIAPRHLVIGMTAGLLRVARAAIQAGREDQLTGLAGELTDWMLALPSTAKSLSTLLGGADSGEAPRREPRPFPDQKARPRWQSNSDDQGRLLSAVIDLAALEGPAALTEDRLRARAEISRRRFRALFESPDKCFLMALEMLASEAAGYAGSWSESAPHWEHRTCRFVLSLCAQAARNPAKARLLILGMTSSGYSGLVTRERMINELSVRLRSTIPAECRPSSLSAEASIAAAWRIVQHEVSAGRTTRLPATASLVAYILLAPVIGATRATVEIAI